MAGCGQVITGVQKTLITDSTVDRFEPFTPWMPVIGIDEIIAAIKARAMLNTLHFQVAVQYAAVRTDDPGAWAMLPTLSYITNGAGEYTTGLATLQGGGANQFFVRFGVIYKSSAAATRAEADVFLEPSFNACGRVVGSADIHVVAESATGNRFEPVTAWMPSVQANKVKAALVAHLGGANFRFMLGWQRALTSPQAPGAWGLLQSTSPWPYTASGEYNTGEIALTYGATREMWVRFGIAYSLSSGTFGEADISAAVAVRT